MRYLIMLSGVISVVIIEFIGKIIFIMVLVWV